MEEREFQELIETYGARPDRWPVDRRQAAQRLLLASSRARALAEREAALDAALDVAERPAERDVERIVSSTVAAARTVPQLRPAGRRPLARGSGAVSRWLTPGIMAGAAAAGMAFGMVTLPAASGPHAYGIPDVAYGPSTLQAMME